MSRVISRRSFVLGAFVMPFSYPDLGSAASAGQATLYGSSIDGGFPVAAINLKRVRPEFLRQEVEYRTTEPQGTIVIDPANHYLYRVAGEGKAVRYGVGVGREGFAWSGDALINEKREWPNWYPPKEMLDRQPALLRRMIRLGSGLGMPGGPGNPLGARALYLWQNNRDTLYRIHGTTEPWTIGTNASSGCIRMMNQDVMHLYAEVAIGTRVVVLGSAVPAVTGRGYMRDLPPLDSIVRDPGRLLQRGLY